MKTTIEETPYHRAQREFNDIFANQHIAKRNWKNLSFGLLIMNAALVGVIVYLLMKSEIIPVVVPVDNFGRAFNYGLAETTSVADQKIIRAFLYRFVDNAKSVVLDPHVRRIHLRATYKVVTSDIARNFLEPHYHKYNPHNLAKSLSRQISPISFLQQSSTTYQLEWSEQDRDLHHKEIGEKRYFKALISIVIKTPESLEEVKENPYNPFGIYITSLSWDIIK